MHLSLRQAAKEAGVAKTTLIRALKSGRLSAQKNDLGDWAIDPAELHRVFPLRVQDQEDPGRASVVLDRDASPTKPREPTPDRERIAALAGEVKALTAETRLLREMVENLKGERDG